MKLIKEQIIPQILKKVNYTPAQTMKAQRVRRGVALPLL
jgi:hypothetical protein